MSGTPNIKVFLLMAAVVAAVFIIACSPDKYKTLSVFFDGVPDPYADSIAALQDTATVAEMPDEALLVRARPQMVLHPPYQERECGMCHNEGQMGQLSEPMPGLCYTCHEDFKDQYTALHGPVDAGYCTQCHNPHAVKNEHLLIRTGQEMCYYCHKPEDVLRNEMHEDIEDAGCTECHNPHGGDDRFILN